MATKLLLIEDVEDLGRSGDVVSVKPGYARNKLIPSKAAVLADKRALRMQTRLQDQRVKKAAEDKSDAELIAQRLKDQTITTVVKVDHDGHMYGSVALSDVLHLIEDQLSVKLEKRSVLLAHPIKKIGKTEIQIKLPEGVTTSVLLKVSAEGQEDVEEEIPVVAESPEAEA